MNVLAISTSAESAWRWRIVDLRGETVEESSVTFPTITAAVAAGHERAEHHRAREPRRLVRGPAR